MRLVIAHSQLNSFGGGERALLELLRRLSPQHQVILWTSQYKPEATYPELAQFPRRTVHAYEWFTARPDADVVIAQTFGARLLALRHPRTLCYVHTMRSQYLTGGRRPDLIARRIVDQAAVENAAQLFTNSAYTAQRMAATYRRNATVLAPGVDEEFFALPMSAGRYALYVGRLAPEKGIERVLQWSTTSSLPLLIAGTGEAAYMRHLHTISPPPTQFVGPHTGASLRNLYRDCRYLVFLPYHEEFGLAALEAMAAGKPVIAARDGALPELVVDNQTGFLVASRDEFVAASARLARDDALCVKLGQQGRETARAYSWERYATGIEEACWSILARNSTFTSTSEIDRATL